MWKSFLGLGVIAGLLVSVHNLVSGSVNQTLPTGDDERLQSALQSASQWLQTARNQAQTWVQQTGIVVPTVTVTRSQDGTQVIEIRLDRHLGIHRLPAVGTGEKVTAGPVTVSAGDRGVSAVLLRRAADVIDQVSIPVLNQQLGARLGSAQVMLFSSPQSYGHALARAGVPQSEIRDIVSKTGGLTVGSEVWIPMYAVHGTADMANVLTHELTHVWFNQQQVGDSLPTWVNEGVAWMDGMAAEREVSPLQAQALAEAYNTQLREAAASGALLPLSASESQILQADYNVEWEDYLAVSDLVKEHGATALQKFLTHVGKDGVNAAFQLAFGTSRSAFEQSFLQSLEQSLASGE